MATTDADEASTIIERCAHGQSLAGFSPSAYAAALQELTPTDREYSDCEELIRNAELAASTSVPTATPTPLLGKTATAKAISGTVRVRLQGTHVFVVLSALTSLPDGSEVDATHGTVLITAATRSEATASAEAHGGRFVIEQERKASAETHLILSLPLTGCPLPRVALLRGASAAATTASASAAKHTSSSDSSGGAKSRHLWVSEGGGSWGTNGRYVSTSVEGTRWLTLDTCDRSEVEVVAGRVRVHNLVTNKTKVLTAGESYVATRRPSRRRR